MKKRIAIALLAAVLAVSTISYGNQNKAKATTSDDLETQQEEVNSELEDLNNELDQQNSDLDSLSEEIADLEQEIADTTDELSSLEKQLEETQALADQQYEDMKLRIQYMYENANNQSWMYLMESKSFSEFLNRVEYIREISERDKELADEYVATLDEIKEYQTALEEKQKELVAKQEELKEKQESVLASINSLNEKIEVQEQLSDEIAAQLEEIRAEEIAMKEEEAKQADIEAEKQRAKELEEELRRKKEEQDSNDSNDSDDSNDSNESDDTNGSDNTSDSDDSEYVIPVSSGEIELFAALLFCEAGDMRYPDAMRYAVASVVVNRVMSSGFPNTITGVIYQSGQFSPASHVISKFNMTYLAAVLNGHYWTTEDKQICTNIVIDVLKGNITGDWLYFRYDPNGEKEGEHIGTEVFY